MSIYVRTIGVVTGVVTVLYICRKFHQFTFQRRSKKEQDVDSPMKKTVGYFTKYVMVPRGAIGLILGRHGKNARQLEFETKTFTQVCYLSDAEIHSIKTRDPLSQWDTSSRDGEEEDWYQPESAKKEPSPADKVAFIKIQGKEIQLVELAICKIQAIVFDWKRNNCVEQMKIPREAAGYVIGKHGRNMKSIGQTCRVQAYIIKDAKGDDEFEIMEIRGTEEGVEAAIKRFDLSIERYYRSRQLEEEEATEFAPEPMNAHGLYVNVADELANLEKMRLRLEEEDEEEW